MPLADLKLHLQSTDYGGFLQNETGPLVATTVAAACTKKLVDEFHYMRSQAVEPLSKFLDYITYGYMIDNIVLIITGTLHGRDSQELMEKCHPLGIFEAMETLCTASTPRDLYGVVLVDTPIAPYFLDCLHTEDLNEMNIEIIRNKLYKAYLEDFYRYCLVTIGGTTGQIMKEILDFEADRRSINITLNSIGTELTRDDRGKLYPRMGVLHPEGTLKLTQAEDTQAVYSAIEHFGPYRQIVNETAYNQDRSLENGFYDHEVKLNKLSFEQQFHYGIFYSYVRLKEQEIRNIVWIAECISQDQRSKIFQYTPIF